MVTACQLTFGEGLAGEQAVAAWQAHVLGRIARRETRAGTGNGEPGLGDMVVPGPGTPPEWLCGEGLLACTGMDSSGTWKADRQLWDSVASGQAKFLE